MKNFFNTIKNSVSSRTWYQDILKGQKPVGFLYIFLLKGIVGIVLTTFLSLTFFSALPIIVKEIKSRYPSELEVKIHDGVLTSNQENPYYLFDKEVVIDTDGTIASLDEYGVQAVITEKSIITKKRNGTIEILPLNTFPNLTINQKNIDFVIDFTTAFKWVIPVLLIIGIWGLGTLSVYFTSLILALVVWFVLKMMKHETTYRNAYSIALYTRTIPILVLLNFLPSLLIVVVMTIIMYKKR
jgi:hypothetical protein